jgi:lipid II:glycine glycyltransferase (peptidoglycan interpeptide bridge formation enzyme)
MTVSSTRDLDVDLWEKISKSSQYVCLFQDVDWARIAAELANEHSFFIVGTRDDKEYVGIRIWEQGPRIRRIVQTSGGPIYTAGSELLANDMLIEVVRLWKKRSSAGSFLFSPYFVPTDAGMFDGIYPERCTFLLDLTNEETRIWKNLNKSARWGVRTSEKKGVRVIEATSLQLWDSFFHIQKQEALRKGYPHMLLSHDILRSIYNNLRSKNKCVLLVALVDNEVIAGSLLYFANRTLQWFRNSSKPQYLSYQPNDALLWNSIIWGRKNGSSVFDLFGASSSRFRSLRGIYDFKRKWGGTRVSTPVYLLGKTYSLVSRFYYSSEFLHELVVKTRRVANFSI